MPRSTAARLTALLGSRPAAAPALPRQRTVGLDDLLDEGVALLAARRGALRSPAPR